MAYDIVRADHVIEHVPFLMAADAEHETAKRNLPRPLRSVETVIRKLYRRRIKATAYNSLYSGHRGDVVGEVTRDLDHRWFWWVG